MRQYHKLTIVLCVVWVATVLYGEKFAFWVPSLMLCSWPRHSSSADGIESPVGVKVAVLADPQLMDSTTFNGRLTNPALEIAKFYADLYIRRAYLGSVLPLKPDAVLFLGDYFDGGPYLLDNEWEESVSRFRHIFGVDKYRKHVDRVYLIPGNHDIGYSEVNARYPKVVQRYEDIFGIRNFQFSLGNVEFISIDAQTLDGNPQSNLTVSSWEFIKNLSSDGSQPKKRVLLTHIPLYRPDNSSCGSYRSSAIINQRIERSTYNQEIIYQNYISDKSSQMLLDLIKPALVLSGHDHDQCTVTHQSKHGPVLEHTIGTVSWQQGNLYPSFMLLSIGDTASREQSDFEDPKTQLCFLPMQTHIYVWYLILSMLTFFSLLVWPTRGVNVGFGLSDFVSYIREASGGINSWKKNEDENCDYDMIWDAEGSVHLVKKPLEIHSSLSSRVVEERGNAVLRPAARKTLSPDMESISSNPNSDVGFGENRKLSLASTKSMTRIFIQRLLRALHMLSIIAAVNVPLYVILIFVDWIEQ